MRYCGISENFHNSAVTFIEETGDISFAAESERYTKHKNDPLISFELLKKIKSTDVVSFYEDVNLRKKWIDHWNNLGIKITNDENVIHVINTQNQSLYNINHTYSHHTSHGASSYYTRPWTSSDDTVILTIDGYGENDSVTIMDHKFNLLYKEVFPKSIGEMYALATSSLGLRSLEEEYIVMGMAAYGNPVFLDLIQKKIKEFQENDDFSIWEKIRKDLFSLFETLVEKNRNDFAASIQAWAEQEVLKLAKKARKHGSKLCYSGGVAQNILANSKIKELFDDIWIMTNPADGGSSLGCAARTWAIQTGNDRLNWKNPYLGFEMGEINAKEVVDHLLEYNYCGIASGRAEFGPRALGNRSLIADPRRDVKDTVNKIKRRQKFRPFAPAILEEYAEEYFEGPMNEYMQYCCKAKHDYQSVTHVDGTARVQIVRKDCESVLRDILEYFYEKTKVPMLLNTSLNIRGKPIVNNKYDCFLFEKLNKTKVFYNDIN